MVACRYFGLFVVTWARFVSGGKGSICFDWGPIRFGLPVLWHPIRRLFIGCSSRSAGLVRPFRLFPSKYPVTRVRTSFIDFLFFSPFDCVLSTFVFRFGKTCK